MLSRRVVVTAVRVARAHAAAVVRVRACATSSESSSSGGEADAAAAASPPPPPVLTIEEETSEWQALLDDVLREPSTTSASKSHVDVFRDAEKVGKAKDSFRRRFLGGDADAASAAGDSTTDTPSRAFVRPIPVDSNATEIADFFGLPSSSMVRVVPDRGVAFLHVGTPEQLEEALARDGTVFRGSKLSVKRARSTSGGASPSSTVFVSRLPADRVDEDTLRAVFSAFGRVSHVKMPRYPDGRMRGFAFVVFDSVESATEAVSAQLPPIAGQTDVSVSFAAEQKQRNPVPQQLTPPSVSTLRSTVPVGTILELLKVKDETIALLDELGGTTDAHAVAVPAGTARHAEIVRKRSQLRHQNDTLQKLLAMFLSSPYAP